MTANQLTVHDRRYVEVDLPPLHHIGLVVIDLAASPADFERR